MLVSVAFYDETSRAYCGRDYTYKTELPLKVFEKVICPTYKGDKRALVTDINLPESSVDPAWADKLKEITKLDKGEKV